MCESQTDRGRTVTAKATKFWRGKGDFMQKKFTLLYGTLFFGLLYYRCSMPKDEKIYELKVSLLYNVLFL